jgi:hypothetical protein
MIYKTMAKQKSQQKDETGKELRDEAKIGGKMPGRNVSEQSDVEQTRLENRREFDLEDKSPAGDTGPEDDTSSPTSEGSKDY